MASSTRVSGNVGYQISPDVETRFYFNANEVRQRIPGQVDKVTALTSPTTAAPINVLNDWQRNIDTVRLANKTTIRFEDTKLEFGAFGVDRHLMHPIFQWLDYTYRDYGGFASVTDDRIIGGYRNRFVAGVNILNGTIDAQQYVNVGGFKATLPSSLLQKPENYSAYAENWFYFVPNVAFVAGTQYLLRSAIRRSISRPTATSTVAAPSACGAQSRHALGGRSDLAGVRQYFAQRRGAELRRERRAQLPEPQLADNTVLPHQAADGHHI